MKPLKNGIHYGGNICVIVVVSGVYTSHLYHQRDERVRSVATTCVSLCAHQKLLL